MKKREPLIFSEQFFHRTDEAIARAVAESAAVGLPKAYLDSYDDLQVKPAKALQDVFLPAGFARGSAKASKSLLRALKLRACQSPTWTARTGCRPRLLTPTRFTASLPALEEGTQV